MNEPYEPVPSEIGTKLQPRHQFFASYSQDAHDFRCAYAWWYSAAADFCLPDGDERQRLSHDSSQALRCSAAGDHSLLCGSANPVLGLL